jgi:hypothetical protein
MSAKEGYWFVFLALILSNIMVMGLSSYCFEYAVKLAPNIGESLSAGTLV